MGKVKTPFNYNVLTIMMMIIIIIGQNNNNNNNNSLRMSSNTCKIRV
jgi:hypothetical protein